MILKAGTIKIVSSASLVSSVVLTTLVVAIINLRPSRQREYAVVIDAGASSSKVYVFSWLSSSENATKEDIKENYKVKLKWPISSLIDEPQEASNLISKVLINISKEFPKQMRSYPLLYFGATAGLRMLEAAGQGDKVEKLISVLQKDFSKLEYRTENVTKHIRVISGNDEARALWTAANYLSDKLKEDATTLGVLGMGGGSFQIAFDNTGGPGSNEFYLSGETYHLYDHSYSCFGKHEAQTRLLVFLWMISGSPRYSTTIKNPCYHDQYSTQIKASELFKISCTGPPDTPIEDLNLTFTFKGTNGQKRYCFHLVSQLFTGDQCRFSKNQCKLPSSDHPRVPPTEFIAVAGFYYTNRFFSNQIEKNKILSYCRENWTTVSGNHKKIPEKYLRNYCFDGAYVHTLLNRLRLSRKNNISINYSNSIGDQKVSWPLGYLLMQS